MSFFFRFHMSHLVLFFRPPSSPNPKQSIGFFKLHHRGSLPLLDAKRKSMDTELLVSGTNGILGIKNCKQNTDDRYSMKREKGNEGDGIRLILRLTVLLWARGNYSMDTAAGTKSCQSTHTH